MKAKEVKKTVENYRAALKKKAGTACVFNESGPVEMSVIDALVAALEAQEARIKALEAKDEIEGGSFVL